MARSREIQTQPYAMSYYAIWTHVPTAWYPQQSHLIIAAEDWSASRLQDVILH